MQTNSDQDRLRVNERYRVMIILWSASVFSVALYFLLSLFTAPPESHSAQSHVITFVLTASGTFLVIISLDIRQRFLRKAEEKQSPALVQSGLIVALALCDTTALLALVDHLVTGNHSHMVMFIVALIGMLLHFPRRSNLAAASYRQQSQNAAELLNRSAWQ